ncbi:MAG TPA: hypothetical protein VGH75_05245 [Steroidobacteraceae bacterium]
MDLLVRIEYHGTGRIISEPDRQAHLQLATPRLVALTAEEARLENVQLRFAHGALETQQEAIVEVRRVIDAILIEDQRAGEGRELEQTVPVGIVARQPRHFQAQYDASAPKGHLAD